MTIFEVIDGRRSVRSYQPRPVERPLIEKLISLATKAPSAMNSQPWAFVVINDKSKLRQYSSEAKALLLASLDEFPHLAKYQEVLANPEFDIFYGAPALIVIYAKPEGPQPREDCCLAAQNLMLAAYAENLGTCWIGFARVYLNQPAIKAALNIPQEYEAVAPLIVGYPAAALAVVPRKPAEILVWA